MPIARTTDADRIPRGPYANVYEDVYARFPQVSRQVGSRHLSMISASQNSHQTTDPPVGDIVLRSVVQAAPVTGSIVNFGDGPCALSGRAGSLYVAPDLATAEWKTRGQHKIRLLALPRSWINDLLPDAARTDPFPPLYGRELFQPEIGAMIERLWHESRADAPVDRLLADGLLLSLVGLVARLGAEAGDMADHADLPLDAARLNRLTDWIEANLATQISIDRMAALVCLSPAHFARRFKAATGKAPHTYVLDRRVSQAQRMLTDGDLPLSELALSCGFSSQSHMTAQFRARIGTTPARFRTAQRA